MSADASANPAPPAAGAPPPRPKAENPWLNLIFNAVLPGILLTYLGKPKVLGPIPGLIISLSLPLAYGAYDLIRRRHWNTFSLLGLAGLSLTGGLELMKVDPLWFAVKEAAVPAVIGLAIPLSLRSSQPLVKSLLYNDQVLDTRRIEAALDGAGRRPAFETLLRHSSWLLALSFIVSGGLNFALSRWLITAPANTPERIAQLGKLHLWNWPVVFVPSAGMMMWILIRLVKELERLTGLTGDDLFHPRPAKPAPPGPATS